MKINKTTHANKTCRHVKKADPVEEKSEQSNMTTATTINEVYTPNNDTSNTSLGRLKR